MCFATELVDQTNRHHVDVASVTYGVIDTITLKFAAHGQGVGKCVLKANADFVIGIALVGIRVGYPDRSGP